MTPDELIAQVALDIKLITEPVTVGTADRKRKMPRHAVALTRMEEWARSYVESGDGTRGGSSTSTEIDDRREIAKVSEQVEADLTRMGQLAVTLAAGADEMRRIVARNFSPIDYSQLPEPKIPGCRSCARTKWEPNGNRIGGHFQGAMPEKDELVDGKTIRGNKAASDADLCRWCWDYAATTAAEAGQEVTRRFWPPVKACDLYHTQGARVAGSWLAKRRKAA